MDDIARIRALTGITEAQISDADMQAIIDLYPGQIYCAAAAAADRMATSLIGGSGVTAVEDISVDRRRPVQAWWDLADRLRKLCEADDAARWDDGPAVVEFAPYGAAGVEAVESWRS